MTTEIELDESVDTHTHPRNKAKDGDGRMEMIVPLLAEEHGVIGAMGNCKPAVTTIHTANDWRHDIASCIPPGNALQVLIGVLIRDDTDPLTLQEGYDQPEGQEAFDYAKVFFSGVSNDGGNSVSDIRFLDPIVKATLGPFRHKQRPMTITFHAERKFDASGKRLPMHEREWYAIKNDVEPLIRANPQGIYTIAHVTDGRTIDWILRMRAEGFNVYGEIGAHYLYRCHEDLYEAKGGGTAFQANDLCWPIYKAEYSMQRLRFAALSGEECFHYGSDWACHADDPTQEKGVKITSDGEVCGGVSILPAVGKSLVIELFMENGGSIEKLNAFLSGNARKKLGLPPSPRKVRYIRKDWIVPHHTNGVGPSGPIKIPAFMRGETRKWQRAA